MGHGGFRNDAGRPKGSPNKIGKEIREAISEALKAVGGKDYLIGLATTNPQVFCALVSKIIPQDHNHSGSVTITHEDALGLLEQAARIGSGDDREGDQVTH